MFKRTRVFFAALAVAVIAACAQPRGVLSPRLHGIAVVEADGVSDGLPEPLDVRLAEDLLRLPLGRERGDRPVHPALVLRTQLHLHGLGRARLADARLVEVGEQLGLGVTADHDQRAAGRDRLGAGEEPRRRCRQLLLGRRLDEGAAKVVVGVPDVDEPGAGAVAGACEGAGERCMLDERRHEQGLALLHVGADPHDQVGVAIDAFHA